MEPLPRPHTMPCARASNPLPAFPLPTLTLLLVLLLHTLSPLPSHCHPLPRRALAAGSGDQNWSHSQTGAKTVGQTDRRALAAGARSSTSTTPHSTNITSHKQSLEGGFDFQVSYDVSKVSTPSGNVTLNLAMAGSVAPHSWMAFAFSPDGYMENSDAFVAWVGSNGQAQISPMLLGSYTIANPQRNSILVLSSEAVVQPSPPNVALAFSVTISIPHQKATSPQFLNWATGPWDEEHDMILVHSEHWQGNLQAIPS